MIIKSDEEILDECERLGEDAVEAKLKTNYFNNPSVAHEWLIKRKRVAEESRIQREMRSTRWALYASWMLVIISFFAAWWQRDDAQAQLKEQREDIQKQLRAYVYVKPPPAGIQGVTVGSTAFAVVALRNSGQTPAYEMKIRGNIGFGPYPLEPNQRFIEGPYGGSMVLNPESETTTGGVVSSRDDTSNAEKLKNAISRSDLDTIRDGTKRRLYLFGSVTYRDAFGAERHSDYCFAYYGAGRTLTTMNYCDRHNGQY